MFVYDVDFHILLFETFLNARFAAVPLFPMLVPDVFLQLCDAHKAQLCTVITWTFINDAVVHDDGHGAAAVDLEFGRFEVKSTTLFRTLTFELPNVVIDAGTRLALNRAGTGRGSSYRRRRG